MKKILFILLIFTACQKENLNIEPSNYLSTKEIDDFKYKIIRYVDRLPAKVTEENKFKTDYDSIYKEMAKNADLIFYHTENDTVYFAITKIAPSIKLKKTATVGKLKMDNGGNLLYYEEAFRTWKMEDLELKEKTKLLFEKYVKNEDLTPYYTKHSGNDFYIEFPDDATYYDVKKRKWSTRNAF